MNRKLFVGAAALLLPVSVIGATAATAGAKAPKPPKPAITGVAFSDQSPTLSWSEPSSDIAPYQTATLTISGTNLPTVSTKDQAASEIVASAKGKGLYGLTGSVLTVTGLTSSTSSALVVTVEGPTGDNLISSVKNGDLPGTLSLTYNGTKAPTTTVQSNCGPTLPAAATAGDAYSTYTTGPNTGSLDVADGSTAPQAGLTYFDVTTLGYNLCSDDIGSATTIGSPTYTTNYPIQVTGTGSSSTVAVGKKSVTQYFAKDLSFSFDYTTARELDVSSTAIQYQLNNYKTGASCTAGDSGDQPSGIIRGDITCSVSAKGLVTVNYSGSQTYSPDSTVSAPVVNISGAVAKNTANPVTVTAEGDTSNVTIGGIPIAILFGPRAGSSSATYAALTL